MSFDIVLFDPERAPADAAGVRAWAVADSTAADETRSGRIVDASQMLSEWAHHWAQDHSSPGEAPPIELTRAGAVLFVSCPYSLAQEVSKQVIEIAALSGCGVYEISTKEGSVWFADPTLPTERVDHFTLTLANYGEYPDVSPALLAAAIARVGHTRQTAAPFIILERTSDGDYVQSLGGDSQFVAEKREWSRENDSDFTHWAAVSPTEDARTVRLDAGDFSRDLPADNVLTRDQAREVLMSFLEGREVTGVVWRDITDTM